MTNPGSSARKILIVEDNLVNQRIVQGIISHLGHSFIAVLEGKQAFEVAKNEKPDLIILDIQLTDISGVEIAKRIRQDDELKDIPIIVSTSFSSLAQKEEIIRDTKCNDFMPKPINTPLLVQMMSKYLPITKETNWSPSY